MEINADIEQLHEDIKADIKRADSKRRDQKNKSAFMAIYVGVVSAITTVCIGIVTFLEGEDYKNFFGITSLLASASLTVVSAWDGIFNHKSLWINSATRLTDLYELETDIRHYLATAKEPDQNQINEFYKRYKRLHKESSERWLGLRKQ
ncbi:MAG: DUF4231 domain-containing protein [Verrucomicrobiota bacterium]